MKKSFFSKKWILALPALGLALWSCDDKQEPFLNGGILGFALQVEDPANHGNFKYIPDIRAATASASDVINPVFTWSNSPLPLAIDSPFRDGFENRLGHATYDNNFNTAKANLPSLNGKYTFSATNTEMKDMQVSFTWSFSADAYNTPNFTEGWGENPDPAKRYDADHYERFEYDGTWVRATVNPFSDRDEVFYYLMSAQYMQINPSGTTDPVQGPIDYPDDFTLSRVASEMAPENQVSVPPNFEPGRKVELSWYLPKNQYHGTRVAIVAIKNVRKRDSDGQPDGNIMGTVMMRTEFKTITKEKNWFNEDPQPNDPNTLLTE